MNSPLPLPESHAQILCKLVWLMPPKEYVWALTGSAGLRLQGVDTPVNDIDIQTDKNTVYELEKKLADYMQVAVHPWESEHTFSLHGQAEMNGIMVELIGDIKHRQPGGSWEDAEDISANRIWVSWRELEIPVFPLDFEARAYAKMGRNDKVRLIREAAHD